MEQIEELLEITEHGARRIAEDFEDPDDDWVPIMLFRTKEDRIIAAGIEIDENKDQVAVMITGALKAMGAVEVALITSSYCCGPVCKFGIPGQPSAVEP